MAKQQKISWKTEQRTIKSLIVSEINPRKISKEKKEALQRSLEKFNLADIPVLNTDSTIISGNQRLQILFELGKGEEIIDVRVPNRELTEAELKEYMLIANTHAGEFDAKLLEVYFSDTEIEFEIPEFIEEQDYSGKNREVDVSNFKNEMKMGLTFTNENYLRVKDELNKRTMTPEAAMLKFLFNE